MQVSIKSIKFEINKESNNFHYNNAHMDTLITELKRLIQFAAPGKTLTKQIKTELLDSFKKLKENNRIGIDNEKIDNIVVILEKEFVTKQSKQQIKKEGELIIKEFDDYLVAINKQDKVIINQIKVSDNPPISSDVKSVNEMENELDSQVEQYNRYTETNPMLGITWNDKLRTWRIYDNNYEVNTKTVNKNNAIELMKNKIIGGTKNLTPIENICAVNFVSYKNKNLIIYNTLEDPLFDIRHIIKLLDIDREDVKYVEFKDKITHYGFKKNIFEGYIKKEFILESIMFNLIMSSNSDFSKDFKKDVGIILCQLRQNNMLIIEKDNLVLTMRKPNYNKSNINDNNIDDEFAIALHDGSYDQTYDNPLYNDLVKDLVKKGAAIPLQKYADQHVLYCFIITISDKENLNRIFCKIGYTSDIIKRIKSLRTEYYCGIYLIGLKYVQNEQAEKKFHASIKTAKKYLVYQMQLNGKDKDEIYIFDRKLYNEFDAYIEYKINVESNIIVDKQIVVTVMYQYQQFIKYLNDLSNNNVCNYLTETQITENDKVRQYNLEMKNKEIQYNLDMREYNLEMQEYNLKMKDRELLIEIQKTEQSKQKNSVR